MLKKITQILLMLSVAQSFAGDPPKAGLPVISCPESLEPEALDVLAPRCIGERPLVWCKSPI